MTNQGPTRDAAELSDLTQPFSSLRLETFPPELKITRRVFEILASADENPKLSESDRMSFTIGALVWAVRDLERELVALHAARG